MSQAGKMILRTIEGFKNEGKLDPVAFDEVMDLALADGHLDGNERHALKQIIFALDSRDLTPHLWEKIELLVKQFSLDE